MLVASDMGDAPDTGTGTGLGNYNTLSTDNGPRHAIMSGLQLGAAIDVDIQATPNAAANGDDKTLAPDDEDGLNNPVADLTLTMGAQPTVNVIVTNMTFTGNTLTSATLSGWIDYNANGVFDNATERAQATIGPGANNQVVTLTFPAVPAGFTGKTYARFRLSTDPAASNPSGPASDGEVEDYAATITKPSDGTANSAKGQTITTPVLQLQSHFGSSVAALGDLDGDGVTDVAVGATGASTGGTRTGAVHALFLNSNGTVKNQTKIASDTNGGPTLADGDQFGSSVAALGDLDGDGVIDLAVGADGDDTGGVSRGAVYVLFMQPDGTVKSTKKIASGTNGGPSLLDLDRFGNSVAALGDLDGDGVVDLAVGADHDDTGGIARGALHVLFMKSDGTVRNTTKIASDTGGGPTLADDDNFGSSVAALGDLDGDGVTDLAVGAEEDDTGSADRGAVHVLFMKSDGTVKHGTKIASDTGGGPTLADDDNFGSSVAALGDLDGDGVTDLAVGASSGGTGGTVHVLFMNANGTVKSRTAIPSSGGGGPTLESGDGFGSSLAALGDLDSDGVIDLAAGARDTSPGVFGVGAVHILFLNPQSDFGDAPTAAQSGFAGSYPTTVADNGARHQATGPRLGSNRDSESFGQPTASADGDDTAASDDEDGVTFPTPLLALPASPRIGSVTVNLQTPFILSNRLDAWVDFNRDGDWNDAGEQIFVSQNLGTTAGLKNLSFTIPAGAAVGETHSRFRLSTSGGLAPTGLASNGEVEDYKISVGGIAPDPANPSQTALFVFGTAAADEIKFQKKDVTKVEVFFHGTSIGTFEPTGRIIASGLAGDDKIEVSQVSPVARPVTFSGGPGQDSLFGGDGNDSLLGETGNDSLVGGGGNDSLSGGTGNDSLSGGLGADTAIGGPDCDTADASTETVNLGGQPCDGIVLRGTSEDDQIRLGFDFIPLAGFEGCSAEDALAGRCPHREILLFELNGQTSRVEYDAGGTIIVFAGEGNDRVETGFAVGAHWHMELRGGDGRDTLVGGINSDLLVGGDGNDVLEGLEGDDQLRGGDDEDILRGGAGNDLLRGNDGDDWLLGGTGNDSLRGGDDDDSLDGGDGDDRLRGDDGRDLLFGGLGIDAFFADDDEKDKIFAEVIDLLLEMDRRDKLL